MHVLRTSSMLARLVLAGFLLALSVAAVSPIVYPKAMAQICTADGKIVLAVDSDGQPVESDRHMLDCALCLMATGPASEARVSLEPPQALAHASKPVVAAHIAALVGAPLPARGPPFPA